MIGALAYLQLTSLKNAARGRLLRLRQPRYLVAAVVGAAYFYFLFFMRAGEPARTGPLPPMPASLEQRRLLVELFGGFALLVAVAAAWILPNGRAALAFTEAEVAHLFPAPVSRRTLIHFKLIKSQLSILFSTLLLALISNRWTLLGGNGWLHAAGWWIICSLYSLHFMGASFAREKLLLAGCGAVRRRLAGVGVLAMIGAMTWLWFRRTPPAPSGNDLVDIQSLLDYVRTLLSTPPLGWVLYPFRLVVRPFLAPGLSSFLAALGPALLLLLLHYVWVVRADVAFEEASAALAQKRAELLAAAKAGKAGELGPKKKRKEPFVLEATGEPSLAFFWKGLLASGPFYYPRNWIFVGVLLVSGVAWFGRDPLYRPLIGALLAFCVAVGSYGILFGPILARRGLAQMLQRLDVSRAYPLEGWQIVLGELLCPVVIFCLFEWIILSLAAVSALYLAGGSEVSPSLIVAGWLCSWLLLLPLAALLFALNFAGALYFPGWVSAAAQPGGGVEKVGHRLIFLVGYLMVLVASLLPAALFASVPVVICLYFAMPVLAVVVGSVAGGAVLSLELAAAVWWLGRRFEQFDLSVELSH